MAKEIKHESIMGLESVRENGLMQGDHLILTTTNIPVSAAVFQEADKDYLIVLIAGRPNASRIRWLNVVSCLRPQAL